MPGAGRCFKIDIELEQVVVPARCAPGYTFLGLTCSNIELQGGVCDSNSEFKHLLGIFVEGVPVQRCFKVPALYTSLQCPSGFSNNGDAFCSKTDFGCPEWAPTYIDGQCSGSGITSLGCSGEFGFYDLGFCYRNGFNALSATLGQCDAYYSLAGAVCTKSEFASCIAGYSLDRILGRCYPQGPNGLTTAIVNCVYPFVASVDGKCIKSVCSGSYPTLSAFRCYPSGYDSLSTRNVVCPGGFTPNAVTGLCTRSYSVCRGDFPTLDTFKCYRNGETATTSRPRRCSPGYTDIGAFCRQTDGSPFCPSGFDNKGSFCSKSACKPDFSDSGVGDCTKYTGECSRNQACVGGCSGKVCVPYAGCCCEVCTPVKCSPTTCNGCPNGGYYVDPSPACYLHEPLKCDSGTRVGGSCTASKQCNGGFTDDGFNTCIRTSTTYSCDAGYKFNDINSFCVPETRNPDCPDGGIDNGFGSCVDARNNLGCDAQWTYSVSRTYCVPITVAPSCSEGIDNGLGACVKDSTCDDGWEKESLTGFQTYCVPKTKDPFCGDGGSLQLSACFYAKPFHCGDGYVIGETGLGCVAETKRLVCPDGVVNILGRCVYIDSGCSFPAYIPTGHGCAATDLIGVTADVCDTANGFSWNGILCSRGGITSPVCQDGYDGPLGIGGPIAIGLCSAPSADANYCDDGLHWNGLFCELDVPSGWFSLTAVLLDRLIINGFFRLVADTAPCTLSTEHNRVGPLCAPSCPLGFKSCGGVGCAKSTDECVEVFTNDLTKFVIYAFGMFLPSNGGTHAFSLLYYKLMYDVF